MSGYFEKVGEEGRRGEEFVLKIEKGDIYSFFSFSLMHTITGVRKRYWRKEHTRTAQ